MSTVEVTARWVVGQHSATRQSLAISTKDAIYNEPSPYRIVSWLSTILPADSPRVVSSVYGHFGTKTLRHQDTSAPVPKCPSDTSTPVPKCRDTSAPVVTLVNGGSYVVDGEGSLKQSTFMCRFLWIVGFEVSSVVRPCDGAIATSVENASCVIIIIVMV